MPEHTVSPSSTHHTVSLTPTAHEAPPLHPTLSHCLTPSSWATRLSAGFPGCAPHFHPAQTGLRRSAASWAHCAGLRAVCRALRGTVERDPSTRSCAGVHEAHGAGLAGTGIVRVGDANVGDGVLQIRQAAIIIWCRQDGAQRIHRCARRHVPIDSGGLGDIDISVGRFFFFFGPFLEIGLIFDVGFEVGDGAAVWTQKVGPCWAVEDGTDTLVVPHVGAWRDE